MEKLRKYLKQTRDSVIPQTYTTPGIFSAVSEMIIDESVPELISLGASGKVLDVGIGSGYALDLFKEKGFDTFGITVSEEEAGKARDHDVRIMDMSFLSFLKEEFDVIWARHCLEHSIMPAYTLQEFHRIMKPGGIIYVEVPAPMTESRHENNPWHYSVLGKLMWASLIRRAGFINLRAATLKIRLGKRTDQYFKFIAKRGD